MFLYAFGEGNLHSNVQREANRETNIVLDNYGLGWIFRVCVQNKAPSRIARKWAGKGLSHLSFYFKTTFLLNDRPELRNFFAAILKISFSLYNPGAIQEYVLWEYKVVNRYRDASRFFKFPWSQIVIRWLLLMDNHDCCSLDHMWWKYHLWGICASPAFHAKLILSEVNIIFIQ